jgi:hypothetical protein
MNGLPNPGSAAKLLVRQRSRAPKVVVARTVPNSAVAQLFFSVVLPLIDRSYEIAPLLLRVSAARTPFPVQSPGAGAVPCTVCIQMGEGDAHPFACAPARIRLQGGQVAFFGAGRGRVVSSPRGVVPDMPPVPSVGGAVGTAARRPAPAGQLVIVIGELGAALRLFRDRRSLERQSIF